MQETAQQQEKDAVAQAAAEARGEKATKRRGRPVGSKTKQRPEDTLGPAGTPLEAMHRMISTKKLSSKINYSVLDNLFDQLRPALRCRLGPVGPIAAGYSSLAAGSKSFIAALTWELACN